MSRTTFIERMLDSGAMVKLTHCFENKGPAAIPSCLYYCTARGHAIIPMGEDSEPMIWLMAAMTAAYEEHGPFVEMGFVSDAFGREFDDEDEMISSITNSTQTLSEQHASDPAAAVSEILVAYAIFGDGTEAGGITEYTYGDDGIPVFKPANISTESQGGSIPFILRSFYNFLQEYRNKS